MILFEEDLRLWELELVHISVHVQGVAYRCPGRETGGRGVLLVDWEAQHRLQKNMQEAGVLVMSSNLGMFLPRRHQGRWQSKLNSWFCSSILRGLRPIWKLTLKADIHPEQSPGVEAAFWFVFQQIFRLISIICPNVNCC